MFGGLLDLLQSLSNVWIISGLFALCLLLLIIFQYTGGRLREYSGGYGSLDGKFGYTYDTAQEMVAAYGDEGRKFYFRAEITLDSLFPLSMALLLSLTLLACGPSLVPDTGTVRLLALLPFLAMIADYLENVLVLSMLSKYPGDLKDLAQWGSVVGKAKWVLSIVAGAAALLSLLFWMWRASQGVA